MAKGVQIEIGFNGEVVTISLEEYQLLLNDSQELANIKGYEQHLTRMFDSDARVGLALLERLRIKKQ